MLEDLLITYMSCGELTEELRGALNPNEIFL